MGSEAETDLKLNNSAAKASATIAIFRIFIFLSPNQFTFDRFSEAHAITVRCLLFANSPHSGPDSLLVTAAWNKRA